MESTTGTQPWEVHSFLVFLWSRGAYCHLLASAWQAPRDYPLGSPSIWDGRVGRKGKFQASPEASSLGQSAWESSQSLSTSVVSLQLV